MTTPLETEWTRPSQDTQMGIEDFKDILRRRVEKVILRPMALDGLLTAAETHDDLGRKKYRISINSNDPEIEQAKTLIHEVAHIHYESPYFNLMQQIGIKEDKYEDFIEEETERLFAENSDSVMQVFQLVRLANHVS